MPRRALAPEASVSTNSTTAARRHSLPISVSGKNLKAYIFRYASSRFKKVASLCFLNRTLGTGLIISEAMGFVRLGECLRSSLLR